MSKGWSAEMAEAQNRKFNARGSMCVHAPDVRIGHAPEASPSDKAAAVGGQIAKPEAGTSPSPRAPICLKIRNLGHVPSFKNMKRMWKGKLVTDPDAAAWMNETIKSLAFQLRCELATRGIEITTGLSALSSIAWFVPLDDSRKWISQHSARTLLVSKGDEGADITIEIINPNANIQTL